MATRCRPPSGKTLIKMATQRNLQRRGFRACRVTAKAVNIVHQDPHGRGPFCRLLVVGDPPACPGVYAWVAGGYVRYIGRANDLRQIVHGARINRAYNDYTYIPPSKIGQTSSPRVRVNGLLNRAHVGGVDIQWWWLKVRSVDESKRVEAELIHPWSPPWNRAVPRQFASPARSAGSTGRARRVARSRPSWLRRLVRRDR